METQQRISSWPVCCKSDPFLKQWWKYSMEERDGLVGYAGLWKIASYLKWHRKVHYHLSGCDVTERKMRQQIQFLFLCTSLCWSVCPIQIRVRVYNMLPSHPPSQKSLFQSGSLFKALSSCILYVSTNAITSAFQVRNADFWGSLGGARKWMSVSNRHARYSVLEF